MLLLNFRGSTGFGEASIQSLPGKVGANDVADCLASLQAAVDAGGRRLEAPGWGLADIRAALVQSLVCAGGSGTQAAVCRVSACCGPARWWPPAPSGRSGPTPSPRRAGLADPERVAVIGGSHGGFLTGHLCGQHPDRFRCAVLRNPVCDLSLMIHGARAAHGACAESCSWLAWRMGGALLSPMRAARSL